MGSEQIQRSAAISESKPRATYPFLVALSWINTITAVLTIVVCAVILGNAPDESRDAVLIPVIASGAVSVVMLLGMGQLCAAVVDIYESIEGLRPRKRKGE